MATKIFFSRDGNSIFTLKNEREKNVKNFYDTAEAN